MTRDSSTSPLVKETYTVSYKTDSYTCKLLDISEDEWSHCSGYKRCKSKTVLYYVCCLLTGGLLFFLSYWLPKSLRLNFTHSKCYLSEADTVFIEDQYGVIFVLSVNTSSCEIPNLISTEQYRYFWYKHQKFFYNENENFFKHVQEIVSNRTFYNLTHDYNGILQDKRKDYLSWYGKNEMDVQIKSIPRLFLEESADPFYIFQIFSVTLWIYQEYIYFSVAIIVVSLGSIIISIYQTRKHLKNLRNMIAKSAEVTVMRPDGTVEKISSLDLVPGDFLVIPKEGAMVLCDVVLISGTAIVNESMLTGESVPVTKTSIPKPELVTDILNENYDSITHKRNTLFSGTEVLQTRCQGKDHVIAIVMTTGFSTTKGNLLRSILFPKPISFQFFRDALKFVGVLGLFAFIGFIYAIFILHKKGASIQVIIVKSLDIITIAVPPSLPAAMGVGTVYALQRLSRSKIFCINPSRVNISGKIKLFCFDKTGTLTEDGLDFCGFIRSKDNTFSDLQKSLHRSTSDDKVLIGMASCHSLSLIDHKVTGDPMELKMLEATDWELVPDHDNDVHYGQNLDPIVVQSKTSSSDADQLSVLKQFTFSSDLQRMSVVIHRPAVSQMEVYAKGSPEMIATLCEPSSLPSNHDECLKSYTKQGYRVLSLATKTLDSKFTFADVEKYRRSEAESNLTFLGFIVMKNVLKPETTPVILELQKANIRLVMVTGDNLLTATCIARECQMVKHNEKIIHVSKNEEKNLEFNILDEFDHHYSLEYGDVIKDPVLKKSYHFAMTGDVFSYIQEKYPNLYLRVLVCGTIFARMLPDQKATLVEGLQSLGYGVGMCGDGANDCGALKRAHAGISLSELEASVASPFTSKIPNISCVVKVIKEGRCALVTSFNIFKYMALYSMIQYTTVLLLYSINTNVSDLEYLYIDLFIIMPFAVTMSRGEPASKLVAQRPLGRLMHPFVLFSMISQIFAQGAFQMCIFFYSRMIPDYKPITEFPPSSAVGFLVQYRSYENTVTFCFSTFQYVVVAFVFSVGPPYRQPFYKNLLFLGAGLGLVAFNCILTIKPNEHFMNAFELLSIDDLLYYLLFFGLVISYFLVSFLIDHILIENPFIMKCLKKLLRKKGPRNRYKLILNDIQNDPAWPPSDTPTKDTLC